MVRGGARNQVLSVARAMRCKGLTTNSFYGKNLSSMAYSKHLPSFTTTISNTSSLAPPLTNPLSSWSSSSSGNQKHTFYLLSTKSIAVFSTVLLSSLFLYDKQSHCDYAAAIAASSDDERGLMLVTPTGVDRKHRGNSSIHIEDAAAIEALPLLPLLPHVADHQLSLRTWSEFFQQVADQCHKAATLFARWIFLIMTYTPAVALSPLLLAEDVTWRNYWWKLFKICILTAGPCSVKFAQWISTRPDLFPTELCKQFEHLQSNDDLVPPWEEIEPVFRKHYGANWEGRILELERDPETGKPVVIGGGCIAQVLRGTLLVDDDGRPLSEKEKHKAKKVAIKVTHPGVKHSMVNDIELMRCVTTSLEGMFPSLNQISLSDSVDEFSKLMLDQVDMRLEGENLKQLIANFEVKTGFSLQDGLQGLLQYLSRFLKKQHRKQHVHFPNPHLPLTNHDILIEDYEEGELMRNYLGSHPSTSTSASDTKGLHAFRFPWRHQQLKHTKAHTHHIDHNSQQHDAIYYEQLKKEMAKIGLDAVFKMVFLDNFIHAGK